MRVCVADLEADGLLEEATRVWCGVFKDIYTNELRCFEPNDIDEMLEFIDTCDVLIMHNGIGYDFPLLEKLYGYEFKGHKVDTLLMSRLQNPKRFLPPSLKGKKAGPHSVEAWGARFKRYKPEIEDWSQYTPAMLHRCQEDVEIQHKIFKALQKEAAGYKWKEAHKLTFKLFEILHKQEQHGCLVDQQYMHKCIATLDRWIDRIDRALAPLLPQIREIEDHKQWHEEPFKRDRKLKHHALNWLRDNGFGDDTSYIGGSFTPLHYRPLNLGSNAEVKDFLLESGWIPEQWNFNKDGEKTSAKLTHTDPFEGVQGSMGRLIARRVQCNHRKSQIQGWLNRIRPDGRLPQTISGMASTGRLTHKNVVNVPQPDAFFGKQMRKIFIAPPGYKLVGTDSAGNQLRQLAARMGDPDYIETIVNGKKEDGTDPHSVHQRAAGLPNRHNAKTFIYAYLFGGGDAKIGRIVGGSNKDGSELRRRFENRFPALQDLRARLVREYRSTAKKRVNKWGRVEYYDGWIEGLDGRPVFIESEHKILVYMLQSDEAIMMQYALLFLYKWLTQKGWVFGREYAFVINMHDEYQAEVREDLIEEYRELADYSIVKAGEWLNIGCPHLGETDVGDNWYETH